MQSPVIELRRYLPGVLCCLALFIFFAMLHFVAIALESRLEHGFSFSQTPQDWTDIEFASERMAGLSAAIERKQPGVPEHPWILVGMSSARKGIDSMLLGKQLDQPVVSFTAGGASFLRVRAFADPLIRSRLQPSILFLCVHPFFLVRAEPIPGESAPRATPGRWTGTRAFVDRLIGDFVFIKDRTFFKHWIGTFFYRGRWMTFERLGLKDSAFRTPESAPFVRHEAVGWPKRRFRAFKPNEKAFWETKLESNRYLEGDPAQEAALLDVLRRFRDRGTLVQVVLMPEHSTLRAKVPKEAYRELDRVLSRLGPSTKPWDFRASVPDRDFSDYVHIDSDGRRQFTLLLADRIAASYRPIPPGL